MKYYLAITTSVLAFTSASLVRAQDCAITDCSALGYTESSNQGNCLKCPFGNAWACPEEQCSPDYQYTCTGTGYVGGSGEACGGKYKSCNCASGYEWKDGTCQKEILKPEWGKCNGSAKNCNIGDILYSDGTCASSFVSGKTLIAVVIYKSADGNCAQAMALKPIGSYAWGGFGSDIPGLNNFTSTSSASTDLKSCENTAIITAAGTSSTYPAAWAAHEYKTEGTNAGDWCLPAAGVMISIKNNMSIINNGFNLSGGTPIGTYSYYWSSTEYDRGYASGSDFSLDFGLFYGHGSDYKYNSYEVRPVLEF